MERGKEDASAAEGTEKLQSYKCGEKVSGEMVDQWMRGNSSDGSNGKMTGWFWRRGVGCLRGLGLDGGVFLFCGAGRVEKKNRWRLIGGVEVSRNGYLQELVS